jgi:hypothetical protein
MREFDELDRPWQTPKPQTPKGPVIALLVVSAAMFVVNYSQLGKPSPGSFGPVFSVLAWLAAGAATFIGWVVAGLSLSIGGGRGVSGPLALVVAGITLVLNLLALVVVLLDV